VLPMAGALRPDARHIAYGVRAGSVLALHDHAASRLDPRPETAAVVAARAAPPALTTCTRSRRDESDPKTADSRAGTSLLG